ncbi:MAG: DUF6445 family protein [Erythrobacter sp.]
MQDWAISLDNLTSGSFSSENHRFMTANNFMRSPQTAINCASLQKFAKITPQYPGIRATLPQEVRNEWLSLLAPKLDEIFGDTSSDAGRGWEIQAWFSIVTTPKDQLIPLQRFPHVDGTDPHQLAMMLYLHETDHGGTGFFRHRSSGLSSLTEESFPRYRAALEQDVREQGLPDSAYATDGAPFFERLHASEGAFNQAIFYRGNLLHSGLISNSAELPADPRTGRLTINAFFRPIGRG